MRRTARATVGALVALVVLTLTLAGTAGAASSQPGDARSNVTPCATLAFTVTGIPAVANPFDPAQVSVDATFSGPGGRTFTIPAFFARSYGRSLVNGAEQVTPTEPSPGHWEVRATLPRPGNWQWAVATSLGGAPPTTVAQPDVSCAADTSTGPAANHGFLRRSVGDPDHQLTWDDGTPYFAVGENLGWADGRGTYAYDDWLDKLAAHHVTWIRVWMPSWGFGLEWLRRDSGGAIIESSLGNYASRLDRAWQLDRVIDAARQRGIVVMLTIQNLGAFSTAANSEWADNPYNAANGGPLATPQDLFTNTAAKDLFARRLRYLVGRFAHATNLIWELWNEVDLTGAAPADIVSWHQDMAARLRALDPYRHLQTTSIAASTDFLAPAPVYAPLWSLADLDLVQVHVYGVGTALPIDFTKLVIPNLAALRDRYGKPVLLGEAGVDYRGPAETLAADPNGQGFHELLWSGVFGGSSGTGMSWWWDNVIDPQGWYPTFDGLNALIDGVAFDRERFSTGGAVAGEPNGATLDAFGLRGATTTLVWVRNPANWWHQPDGRSIAGAALSLTGLEAGTYSATWIDPVSGAAVWSAKVTTTVSGVASLEVPTFSGEAAARLVRTGAATLAPPFFVPLVVPAFTG